MTFSVSALISDRKIGRFDVFQSMLETLDKNHEKLQEGDIILISTKYISNSQGRVVNLNKIQISFEAKELSKKFRIKPEISEIIIRESDKIFGGIAGFVITSSDHIMAPNAGIDKSNAIKDQIILYPINPFLMAEQIRRKVFLKFSIHVGVILVDSRLMPGRIGTTGVAISCAGFEPVQDLRSQMDLHGNPLKVTFQAVADSIATIANHKMGEGSDSKPFAIVRNSGVVFTDRIINPLEMAISSEQCVYVRGLGNA